MEGLEEAVKYGGAAFAFLTGALVVGSAVLIPSMVLAKCYWEGRKPNNELGVKDGKSGFLFAWDIMAKVDIKDLYRGIKLKYTSEEFDDYLHSKYPFLIAHYNSEKFQEFFVRHPELVQQ